VLRNEIHPGIAALLGDQDLRAVCFWKDAQRTKLRPIGIGESVRHLVMYVPRPSV